jgi:Uma2 family endonuclease
MTTQPRPALLSADAFIAWAAEQPAGRYELSGGEVVAMAPERAGHTRAKLAAAIALRAAIGARDCEAMVDGMVVPIDERTVYEPDALVRCGPRLPDDATEITDPVIVVEVISPSSRGIDSGTKLVGYFRVPSVRHYLVLDIEARAVVHHRRGDRGGIETRILRDGALALDPPGIEIALADLFPGG